jgi:hypothetical protein
VTTELARNPDAYRVFWADRRFRAAVLITSISMGFIGVALAAWYAGGFRCPRCKQRFAGQSFSLLLRRNCKTCELRVGSRRDLSEPPMFPRLQSARWQA